MNPGAVSGVPALEVRRWPASGAAAHPLPLVLIHGWGGDSAVWRESIPLLRDHFTVITVDLPGFGDSAPAPWRLDALLGQFALALPARALLLGWSLGGMLATAFAHRHPERVGGLITLAANASFVERDGWPAAMPGTLFRRFAEGFDTDAEGTLRQFTALQGRGDARERAVSRMLRSQLPAAVSGNWRDALQLLGELDNREALAALAVPSLHLFGAGDALVPAAAATAVQALNPMSRVQVLDGVGHAPQISAPAVLADIVAGCFVVEAQDDGGDDPAEGYRIDKASIARSFSRAAASYDQVAHLQRAVGGELLALLPADLPAAATADLGCGTGYFTELLARRFPAAVALGVDLAEGMARHARRHRDGDIHWVCGDAEAMPCADGSLGLVFSNFALQWCQDLTRLMAELHRVLQRRGMLVFSTLGPASLWELREAWRAVDSYAHVNRFTPPESVRQALDEAGFVLREFSARHRVNHYSQLRDLTRELKCLGAHNVNRGRNAGLTGRRHLEALKQAYESLRTAQGLPASWEILTVVAEKP